MKSWKVVCLVLGFVFAATLVARAEDVKVKIAYVDLAKIFDEYGKTKAYDKVLEAENNKYQEERNKKIDQIRELQGKIAMLKDAEKAKAEKDMEKLKNDILEFDRQKRTDLTKNRDEKVREILLEIEKTVSEYAKKEGISYVLNDKMLIYGTESANITEPILKGLNDTYKPADTKK
ncbi:MAG: OmpH family outer membrane protein [Candidatus Omnitrophica bacterium]|nr:OmpH family outer membrane protein [Candidatus Omnitrophota bacterium]